MKANENFVKKRQRFYYNVSTELSFKSHKLQNEEKSYLKDGEGRGKKQVVDNPARN